MLNFPIFYSYCLQYLTLFFCKISLLFAIFYLYFVFVLASIKFKALTISSEGEKVLENFWGKNLIRWGWRWWGRRRGQKYNFEIQFFVLELSDWIRNITLQTVDSKVLIWIRCGCGKLCGGKFKYFCRAHKIFSSENRFSTQGQNSADVDGDNVIIIMVVMELA